MYKGKSFAVWGLFAISILQPALMWLYSLTLLYELKGVAVDGAVFQQLLYNVINGNGLSSSINPPYIEQNWLGFHFSPIMYAVVPVYWLFPHIETLRFLQSFLIAGAAIPIFFTSNILLKSQWQALLIAVLYLINPFVINAQIIDFHEIAFAPLTISLMLWAVVAKKPIWFLLFSLLLLAIKEHYGLAVFGVGLLWAWQWKEYKFGLGLCAFGILSLWVVLHFLMPYFSPLGAPAMLDGNSEIDRFSWIKHPFDDSWLLGHIIYNSISYAGFLLLPFLLFLPLLSFPWLLPATSDVAVNMLAKSDMQVSIFSYHSAAVIPLLLIAYVQSIKKYKEGSNSKRHLEYLGATVLISAIFSYFFAVLPFFASNIHELNTPVVSLPAPEKEAISAIEQLVDINDNISVHSNIVPVLAPRRNMFTFPEKTEGVKYIILSTRLPYKKRQHIFGGPYSYVNGTAEKYFSSFNSIISGNDWEVVYYKNNFLLLQRGGQGSQELKEAVKKDLMDLKQSYDAIGGQGSN